MSKTSMRSVIAATATFAVIALSASAFAAGTAPSTGSSGSSGSATSKCDKFKVDSPDWKKCKQAGRSSMNNEQLYATGYSLAKAGDYDGALEFLIAGTDKKDPRFLTMIGYSTRKLGRVDDGMGYYMQALAIDPNSVTTREYLGEAYLQKHDLPGAKAQLSQIQDRCGTTCESYTELNEQIGKYQANL
jgi:tetratricopeptide (TPR) repeat protein